MATQTKTKSQADTKRKPLKVAEVKDSNGKTTGYVGTNISSKS